MRFSYLNGIITGYRYLTQMEPIFEILEQEATAEVKTSSGMLQACMSMGIYSLPPLVITTK